MDELIERSVRKCFANAKIQVIVRNVLINYQTDKENPESLQIIALKSIMKKKMEKKFMSNITFRLIFREYIYLLEYRDREYAYYYLSQRIVYGIWRVLTLDRHRKRLRKLKSDPHMMLELLDQTLNSQSSVEMVLGKRALRLEVSWNWVAKIRNRPGVEYDTFWAEKFARMLLKGKIKKVWILIGVEVGTYNPHSYNPYREILLTNFIDSLNPITPPEGWKQFIHRTQRPPFYMKSDGMYTERSTRYGHYFFIYQRPDLDSFSLSRSDAMDEPYYWGHLEQE